MHPQVELCTPERSLHALIGFAKLKKTPVASSPHGNPSFFLKRGHYIRTLSGSAVGAPSGTKVRLLLSALSPGGGGRRRQRAGSLLRRLGQDRPGLLCGQYPAGPVLQDHQRPHGNADGRADHRLFFL